jgi:hypothetical protein
MCVPLSPLPRPPPLSPPHSLLKAREAPEDRLGQVAQPIATHINDLKAREAPEDRLGQVAQPISRHINFRKAREAPEDRLGQAAQLIVIQIDTRAGTHVVENAIFQCRDTLVHEVQNSRLVGAGACAVQDAAGVCEKTAVAECTRHYFMKRLGPRVAPRHARVRGPDYIRITFGTMRSEEQGEKRHNQERWLRR